MARTLDRRGRPVGGSAGEGPERAVVTVDSGCCRAETWIGLWVSNVWQHAAEMRISSTHTRRNVRKGPFNQKRRTLRLQRDRPRKAKDPCGLGPHLAGARPDAAVPEWRRASQAHDTLPSASDVTPPLRGRAHWLGVPRWATSLARDWSTGRRRLGKLPTHPFLDIAILRVGEDLDGTVCAERAARPLCLPRCVQDESASHRNVSNDFRWV
jgi:hypothetical protein